MFLLLALIIPLVNAEAVCETHPGHYQSPINIDDSTVVPRNIGPVVWSKSYEKMPKSMTLKSDGHTLKLTVEPKVDRFLVFFKMIDEPYELAQIHFHWGVAPDKGAEHTFNNKTFPIEMHAVHTQTENASLPEYLVVGYVFDIVPRRTGEDGPLDKILEFAEQAAHAPNVPMPVRNFKLSDLFGTGPFSYYTYEGSLTVSPFAEGVTWILPKKRLFISLAQLNAFYDAAAIEQGMLNNYRCPQNLENRNVYYYQA